MKNCINCFHLKIKRCLIYCKKEVLKDTYTDEATNPTPLEWDVAQTCEHFQSMK